MPERLLRLACTAVTAALATQVALAPGAAVAAPEPEPAGPPATAPRLPAAPPEIGRAHV